MDPSHRYSYRARKFDLNPLLLLSLAVSFSSATCELVNVTVDDQLGDSTTGLFPQYLPNDGTWHVGSPTEDCSTCKIKPSTLDLSQVHDQTWHDATHSPPLTPATVTVQFNGSAVYVFNILPNTLFNTTTFVNITFSIDGEDAGIFTRSPDSSSTILYNQLVYANAALQDGPHTLVMTAGGDSKSLFLFDYLLYTTQGNESAAATTTTTQQSSPLSTTTPTNLAQSPSPDSSSSTPVGAIAGGVVGGIILLIALAVAALLLRRRSRRARSTQTVEWMGGNSNRGPTNNSGNDVFPVVSSEPTFPSSQPSMRSLDGALPGAGTRTRSTSTGGYHGYPWLHDPESNSPEGSRAPNANAYANLNIPHQQPAHHDRYAYRDPPLPSPPAPRHPPALAPVLVAVNGPDPHSPALTDPDSRPSTRTDQWSSKRRAELAQRLETLQRTRSVLSSPSSASSARAGTGTGTGTGTGSLSAGSETQRALEDLEAEIADLRGVLSALSARLADSNAAGGEQHGLGLGPRESLPAYAE